MSKEQPGELRRFDHDRYSVAVMTARSAGQLRVYADRIVMVQRRHCQRPRPPFRPRPDKAYNPIGMQRKVVSGW